MKKQAKIETMGSISLQLTFGLFSTKKMLKPISELLLIPHVKWFQPIDHHRLRNNVLSLSSSKSIRKIDGQNQVQMWETHE